MRSFVILGGIALIGALTALANRQLGASLSAAPPDPDNPLAWVWAAGEAGANIYVSPRSPQGDDAPASAWIERRFERTPATIQKSLFELRDYDCVRRATRLVSRVSRYRDLNGQEQVTAAPALSPWTVVRPTSVDARILAAACGQSNKRQTQGLLKSAAVQQTF